MWCHITSDQLKIPPGTRGSCTKRSLQSLRTDHDSFERAGGQLKNAKFHHNVIGDYIFDIPLENVTMIINHKNRILTSSLQKVCIPGLHLSLGIYNRLWSLLEEDCTELDLKLAASSPGAVSGGVSFQQYSSRLKDRASLKAKLETQQSYAMLAEQLTTFLSLSNGEESETLQTLRGEAAAARKKANDMVHPRHIKNL